MKSLRYFYYACSGFLKKKRFSLGLAVPSILLVFIGGFIFGSRGGGELVSLIRGYGQNQNIAKDLDYTAVEETYDKLREVFDGELDVDKLLEGAKKGLVEAAGDPYTAYYTDEEAKELMDDIEGKFSGIGAELEKRDNQLTILNTLDDSPARSIGLNRGDIIIKVNDQDITDWAIEKSIAQIRGEKGTTVKLTIVRGQNLKEYSIIRADIVSPSVKSEIINNNVGYLRISRFANGDTVNLARKAADNFKQKNVKGVILDLRGNGGGYLGAAQEITGIWLKDKLVVEEKSSGKTIDKLYAGGSPILQGVRTVVLIDGGSASASEIVAGALKDHNAAILVGTKSFGKGSVQNIFNLSWGGQLKATVARWFTPNGKNISKEGIKPEHEVELSDADIKKDRDPQKDKALQLLN